MTGDQLKAKVYTSDQNAALVYVTVAPTSPSGQTSNVTEEGIYVYSSSQNKWIALKSSSGDSWKPTGNTISSGNFLGSLNNLPLEIKINNVLKTRITLRGQIETLNTSNSVYLGELAGANNYAATANNVFLGYASDYDAGGASNSLILGYNSRVSSNNSIVIGSEADADSNNSISVGRSTQSQGTYGIVIGDAAFANKTGAIAIGQSSQVQGDHAISIGKSTYTSGSDAIAIGNSAQAQATNAVAIGNNVYAPNPNTLILGNNLNVGIGTNNPSTKLHVAGSVKIVDGTQGAGKVLTSDANGLADWRTPINQVYGEVDRTSNLTISNGTANVTFNSTDTGLNRNVSINSTLPTDYIAVNEAGVYEITYSYGIFINDNSDGNINIYLRKGFSSGAATKINKSTSIDWGDNPVHDERFHISKSVLVRLAANERVYMTYSINNSGVNMFLIANTVSLSLKRIDY